MVINCRRSTVLWERSSYIKFDFLKQSKTDCCRILSKHHLGFECLPNSGLHRFSWVDIAREASDSVLNAVKTAMIKEGAKLIKWGLRTCDGEDILWSEKDRIHWSPIFQHGGAKHRQETVGSRNWVLYIYQPVFDGIYWDGKEAAVACGLTGCIGMGTRWTMASFDLDTGLARFSRCQRSVVQCSLLGWEAFSNVRIPTLQCGKDNMFMSGEGLVVGLT